MTGTIDTSTTFAPNDTRAGIPRFEVEARQANQRLVELLRQIGDRLGATPAQVALAWLLRQKPWIVPLFGTRRLERLEENLGALNVELGDADLQALNDSKRTIPITGNRYNEAGMKTVGL